MQPKVPLREPVDKNLTGSAAYLAGQLQSDPQNKLAPQVTTLSATRTNLTALLGKRVTLKAEVDQVDADIVLAVDAHKAAMLDYARAAARFCGSNALLLGALGVEEAKKTGPKGVNKVIGATSKLAILDGPSLGDVHMKCARVPHAGAYVFQYKLEPSQPGDPFLPPNGIETNLVSIIIPGFAPGQKLRGRVRAIGAVSGPWSEEVVGYARLKP